MELEFRHTEPHWDISSVSILYGVVDILEVRRLVLEELPFGFPSRKIMHSLQHRIVDEWFTLDVAPVDLRVRILGQLGGDVDRDFWKLLLKCREKRSGSCLGFCSGVSYLSQDGNRRS